MNRSVKVLQRLVQTGNRLILDPSGVTALEYGLIAALIAGVIITGVSLVGTNLGALFTRLGGSV